MTHDTDMWHMSCDKWWTLCKHFTSLALTVWDLWCFEDLQVKDDLINQWILHTDPMYWRQGQFSEERNLLHETLLAIIRNIVFKEKCVQSFILLQRLYGQLQGYYMLLKTLLLLFMLLVAKTVHQQFCKQAYLDIKRKCVWTKFVFASTQQALFK